VVERNLPHQSIVAGGGGQSTVVITNAIGSQHPHDEFINGGQIGNEVPRVFTSARASVDDGLQFIVCFSPQHLEAGASAIACFVHRSSLRPRVDITLSKRHLDYCRPPMRDCTPEGSSAIHTPTTVSCAAIQMTSGHGGTPVL
jgi:hypothetical protein